MAFKTCIWQKTTWTVPLPVILSVAFALLGGVAALWLTGMLLDIYAQLGLIMLIGLCAKSTILMVEFSMQERASGKSVVRAALNGANYRYRAVLMTAWSFIFGGLPLLFASGAELLSTDQLTTEHSNSNVPLLNSLLSPEGNITEAVQLSGTVN